jgi:hypothetical protein
MGKLGSGPSSAATSPINLETIEWEPDERIRPSATGDPGELRNVPSFRRADLHRRTSASHVIRHLPASVVRAPLVVTITNQRTMGA